MKDHRSSSLTPYYQDDFCTIYHANSRQVMATAAPADVMVTDPPYGVNLGKHRGANETRPGHLVKRGYDGYDDTPENYRDEIIPILLLGIVTYKRAAIFSAVPNAWQLPAPSAIGGVYLPAGCGRMSWGFQNLAPVFFYGKAPNLHLGAKATTISSTDPGDKNGHPCPKPVKWMTWLVALSSTEEETVIDPFMGAGATLLACKELGRHGIGIEREERYCEIAARRLQQEVLNFAPVVADPAGLQGFLVPDVRATPTPSTTAQADNMGDKP